MKNQKISGYIMAIIGFLMLVVNAVGYIFNLDIKNPALTVMGIVFVVIGMGMVRKHK
jgi:hypothetical protein